MSERHAFLTAAEAAAALGVQRATLYAYVSRGLLRSEEDPSGRGRRYAAAEVEALKQRAAGRRDPPALVRDALAWGVPVLDSSLTLIAGGRLYYRGHDAVELARCGHTLEQVAALLWLGDLDARLPGEGLRPPAGAALQPPPRPAVPPPGGSAAPRGATARAAVQRPDVPAARRRIEPAAPASAAPPARLRYPPMLLAADEVAAARRWRPIQRLLAWLPLATADEAAAYDLRPASVVAAGARLLPLLARCAAGPGAPPPGESGQAPPPSAAAILAQGWLGGGGKGTGASGQPGGALGEVERLLNAALVLSADHELNVSAFTARCVASARAPLSAVVLGGLAALSGARHGVYADRVEALFDEIAAAGPPAAGVAQVRQRLADRLRRGEEVPGFGHPLYPAGDPRGRLLAELAAGHLPDTPAVAQSQALAEAARDLLGEHPTLDFGLVALARALALPAGAAVALFAVGRAAGWIAHALEQYADPRLIRPRARYVGPDPAG